MKQLELENTRLKRVVADLTLDNQILREVFLVSERRTCRVLTQPRSTQRYEPMPAEAEQVLTKENPCWCSQAKKQKYIGTWSALPL